MEAAAAEPLLQHWQELKTEGWFLQPALWSLLCAAVHQPYIPQLAQNAAPVWPVLAAAKKALYYRFTLAKSPGSHKSDVIDENVFCKTSNCDFFV